MPENTLVATEQTSLTVNKEQFTRELKDFIRVAGVAAGRKLLVALDNKQVRGIRYFGTEEDGTITGCLGGLLGHFAGYYDTYTDADTANQKIAEFFYRAGYPVGIGCGSLLESESWGLGFSSQRREEVKECVLQVISELESEVANA